MIRVWARGRRLSRPWFPWGAPVQVNGPDCPDALVVGVGNQDIGRLLDVGRRLLDGVLANLVEGLGKNVEGAEVL